ncbi:MAG: two-component regulator propeller domain-containing protein [Planctomycetota bacterium]
MKFKGLTATADLVGRRIWISWEYTLDALEVPGDVPDVLLRRKERDYDFPPLVPADPYLVLDGANFPPTPVPGLLEVHDLPGWENTEDGLRVEVTGVSVAEVAGGVAQETLRHTLHTTLDADGAARRVRVELLDSFALEPRTAYYYELDDGSAPGEDEQAAYRASTVAGGTHGLNHRLYEMLPQVYKRHDVRLMAPEHQLPSVPESSPVGGQLRRFIDLFGMGLDALRSSAEGLLDVHDVYTSQGRFLPALSRMIGWEPTTRFGIPLQRNELATATRLFDVVGTVPALRALVTHQTGWHSQVAELAQHVLRAGEPPRRSVFGIQEGAGPEPWHGTEDASSAFAFPAGEVAGAGALPAVLTSVQTEPFALRAGLELSITVDGGAPARVRFGPDDFADLAAASAAEVAGAINAAFDTLSASDVGGAVELRTHAVGADATLAVDQAPLSLLAWNDAAEGPLSSFNDGEGRLRLFYGEPGDPGRPEQATFPGQPPHLAGSTSSDSNGSGLGSEPQGARPRLLYKSFGYGEWRGELALPDWTGLARAPYAGELADGRILVGWTERPAPHEAAPPPTRLRYALGQPRAALPAVITGHRREPFALVPGMQLTLTGSFGSETFNVLAPDYVDPANATALEVAAAIALQLAAVVASVQGGALQLATTASGDDVTLAVDLAQSTAAHALGLQARRLSGRGSWDHEVDWQGPLAGPRTHGALAEPSLVPDPLGGARVFWSENRRGRYELLQAHWSQRLTVVTPGGAAQRDGGGAWQVWQMADGLPSDDVRAVAVDADGTLWFATPAGLAARRPDNVWSVFTTLDGLADDDVRDLALLPDGSLWCATPAGVSVRLASGAFTTLNAGGSGLVSDDVRAVAADGRGNAWAATPAGVSRLDAGGVWRTWTTAEGLPAGTPRALALGDGERVALATSTGVALLRGSGDLWDSYGVAEGLVSGDVRAAAWGAGEELFAATAAGLAGWDGYAWRNWSASDGLPSDDLRSVALAPDGRLLVGTAAGLASGGPDAWSTETVVDGLPSDEVVGVHTSWSATQVLAAGGGGHREPRAAVDAANRTWLVWARREGAAAALADAWTLRLRRFDPAAPSWSWDADQAVTTSPGSTADREPALEPRPGGGFRVFFSSDRTDGRRLHWVELDNAGTPGALAALPEAPYETGAPSAAVGPAGETWVFLRSDRSLVPSQLGTLPAPGSAVPRPSERVPDEGALRLRSGARPPVLAHASRTLLRREWGDLFTYTPEHPDLIDDETPSDEHLYTRRTLALYLRRGRNGVSVNEEQTTRLLQLLRRFLPTNLRIVLFVAPDPEVELVFGGGFNPVDSFNDLFN